MSLSTISAPLKHEMSFLFYALCFVMLFSITNGSKCDAPPKIGNATLTTTRLRKYRSGSVVNYVCDPFFTKGKDSNGTLTCVQGTWIGDVDHFRCCKLQMCIDPNLFCVLPNVDNTKSYFEFENLSFPIDKGAGTAYGIGTIVKFSCTGDYVLREHATKGPFKCLHGGQWTPNDFTKCDHKDCGPPPTVANARVVKVPSSEGHGYEIREHYKYVCDVGYGFDTRFNKIICVTDLNNVKSSWKIAAMSGPQPSDLDLPKCIKGYTSPADYDYDYGDDSTTHRNRKLRKWTPLENTIGIVILIIIIASCVAVSIRRARIIRATNRARNTNGLAITEYVVPGGGGGGGQTVLVNRPLPPPGSYPTQGGMYPPEAYPLTTQAPGPNTYYNAPPPPQTNYSDVAYKPNTNPLAPYGSQPN